MEFIESLLLIDTFNFVNEICKELKLDETKKEELLKSIIKSNHFIGKCVKNRHLHLMSTNKVRVRIDEIKSLVKL